MLTATIPTPPGPFTLVADDDGAVVASGWAPDAATLLETIGPARLPQVAAALASGELERRDERDATAQPGHDGLDAISQAVRDYVAGDTRAIDAVAVAQVGSPFIARAWQQLRAIPAGEPQTYAQLAESCGRPTAIRAAGSACARNTVALFVPCHRVLRTGGELGGFLYGLDVKRWLLDHEANAVAAAA